MGTKRLWLLGKTELLPAGVNSLRRPSARYQGLRVISNPCVSTELARASFPRQQQPGRLSHAYPTHPLALCLGSATLSSQDPCPYLGDLGSKVPWSLKFWANICVTRCVPGSVWVTLWHVCLCSGCDAGECPVPVLPVHVRRLCGVWGPEAAHCVHIIQHVCVCVQVCMHSADTCGVPMY